MGCHTWFCNDIRHVTAPDLEALKAKVRSIHAYSDKSFEQFKEEEVMLASSYEEFYQDALDADNTFAQEFYLKCILPTKDPLKRGFKKSIWKREQRNIYRLHKKKKLRKGELLGLLRYYGRIQEYDNSNEWMWYTTVFGCDLFRIHNYDKEFYSFKEFEEYIEANPKAVYKVVRDGDVMVNIDHIELSHDMVREQWELNMIALQHAERFFNEYPHGRIELG